MTNLSEKEIAFSYFKNNPAEAKALFMEMNYQADETGNARAFKTTLPNAEIWIDHYQSAGNVGPESFLLPTEALFDHLSNLKRSNGDVVDISEVKYLHVFLARTIAGDPKSTTIVVSAVVVDANIGNHVYEYDADNTPFVLEHVIPCPKCQDMVAGHTIDVHEKIDNSDPKP